MIQWLSISTTTHHVAWVGAVWSGWAGQPPCAAVWHTVLLLGCAIVIHQSRGHKHRHAMEDWRIQSRAELANTPVLGNILVLQTRYRSQILIARRHRVLCVSRIAFATTCVLLRSTSDSSDSGHDDLHDARMSKGPGCNRRRILHCVNTHCNLMHAC